MVQQLIALIVLNENVSPMPNTHVTDQNVSTPLPGGLMPSYDPVGTGTHTRKKNIHTKKDK